MIINYFKMNFNRKQKKLRRRKQKEMQHLLQEILKKVYILIWWKSIKKKKKIKKLKKKKKKKKNQKIQKKKKTLANELYSEALQIDPENNMTNAKLYSNRATVGSKVKLQKIQKNSNSILFIYFCLIFNYFKF